MNTMQAKDVVSGQNAECFITIDGNRYNFMNLKKFESKLNVKISEVPILGRMMKGHKQTSGNGEWSATAYFNQSIMRKLMLEYKRTGVFPYFDIQVTNEDASTAVGRQTIIHKECLIEGGILAKFDADSEYLEEDISGTFDDFEMPETFAPLAGM